MKASTSTPIVMRMETLSAILSKMGFTLPNEMAEIILATPNPLVALDIVLGVYVIPEIPNFPLCKPSKSAYNPTFVDYDKFTGKVTYSYNSVNCVSVWAHKDRESDPSYADANKVSSRDGKPEDILFSTYGYTEETAKRAGFSTKQEFQDVFEQITLCSHPSSNLSFCECSLETYTNL